MCEKWIWTIDLRIMKPTSFQAAPSRLWIKIKKRFFLREIGGIWTRNIHRDKVALYRIELQFLQYLDFD